jgi:hypothetical protein
LTPPRAWHTFLEAGCAMRYQASKIKKSFKYAIEGFLMSATILLALAPSAFAHHGTRASYDLNPANERTFTATVTEFKWGNPHVYILFDVTDDKGNVAHWGAETHPPYTLSKHGWFKEMLKPGDQITITVFPAKAGTPVGLLSKLVFNGKLLLDDEQARIAGGPQ